MLYRKNEHWDIMTMGGNPYHYTDFKDEIVTQLKVFVSKKYPDYDPDKMDIDIVDIQILATFSSISFAIVNKPNTYKESF